MNLKNLKENPAFIMAVVTMAAYGLLLPFTGFYWDDLPFTWITRFLGPAEFNPAFAPFRPFLGPIFYFTTSLIPPVPLYWQVFALVIRLIIGIAAWWAFRQIWRERRHLAWIAALLILIFPGYSQHWVAYTHINQELIPFLFYILSFGFTFKALHSRKPAHIIIALLFQLCGIFPTEYFFGIEGLRFLFLFFHFDGNILHRFTKTTKVWFPYLLVWMLNAAWLVYYYRFGPYNSYEVTATQSPSILYFMIEALDALWKAGFYIWVQILPLTFSSWRAPASLLSLGLASLAFLFIRPHIAAPSQRDPGAFGFLIIGIIGILLGRLPSLAAGLPLTLQSSYDRFMISMMLGGTVFIIGLVEILFSRKNQKTWAFAALIALGVGQQFFNANIFRRDWEKQREIYWQMAWRIPALKPNTVILTHQMPIDYETDMSFTAPINWMYAPNFTRGNLPYLMLYTEKRIGGLTLPSLKPNTPITFPYRTVTFYGNTSQAIVIYMPKNGCLRVLDPKRGDEEIYNRQPKVLTDAVPLSDPSNIIAETASTAAPNFFFSEPRHEWCYYFTKAELAQQQGDHAQAAELGSQALMMGFKPEDPSEWLLFIESYALTGDIKTAEELSNRALESDPKTRKSLCLIWKKINKPPNSIIQKLECEQ